MDGTMTAAELLSRVDGAWKPFRDSIRHLGRAKMGEPTGAGWTYHDLVAHVAGWHDLTARRLRVLHASGSLPGPGDEAAVGIEKFSSADEYNARLVSSHRLVGAEALLDELDTTFRAVREEIAGLTDAQLAANDGQLVGLIAGDTYGHYEEHAKELEQR